MTAVGRPARPRVRGLPKLRGLPPLTRREALWGYLFISPWVIGFLLFTLAPVLASLAFTSPTSRSTSRSRSGSWGSGTRDVLGDTQVWESLGVTFQFAASTCRSS